MTKRARRPTDEARTDTGTDIYSSERQRALFGASPGERIASASEAWEYDATAVDARGAPPSERPTLQAIDPVPPAAPPTPASTIEQATPTEISARPERSEPIRVISMKERAASEPRPQPRAPLHVQLRSMAEVASARTPASGLGRLAPPRDPQQARKRRQRDNVVWACVAILLACAISLGIWLVAGR